MDFHTLSRRELQALCKKNKIPANMTNIAMADALAALPQVEGLEEFLNPLQSETDRLEENDYCVTPGIAPSTATRMSTRRKPNKDQQEPQSSVLSILASRGTRKVPAEKAALALRKVEIAEKEGSKDALVSEDDKVVETVQRKPQVQKVYSTRRSVRLLERTMADLSLSEEKSIEPIKMDELEPETTKEVAEDAIENKEADGDNPETVSVLDCEENDSIAPSDQQQTCPLRISTQPEDGSIETLEDANAVEVSTEVVSIQSDSEPKNVNHKAPLGAEIANETDMESKGEYDSVVKGKCCSSNYCQRVIMTGADALIEAMEQNILTESQKDVELESSLKVDNVIEVVSVNDLEVPSLSEDQINSCRALVYGSESLILEPRMDMACELKQELHNEALVSVEISVAEESAVSKLEMVGPYAEKRAVGADVMDPDLIDIPVMAYGSETATVEPPTVDTPIKEASADEVAATDLQQFQPLTLTPRKVEVRPDSVASDGMLNIEQVNSVASDGMLNIEQVNVEKFDGLPRSLNTKTPTSTKKLLASPLITNKENIIVDSAIFGDPDAKKAKISTANVNEDSTLNSLDEKSLRQLSKMLKEKLQLANKPGDDIPEQQQHTGKVRPALQALPNNRLAVSKKNDN